MKKTLKYLKTLKTLKAKRYETKNGPKKNDYVIVEEKGVEPEIFNFTRNNIGQVLDVEIGIDPPYIVHYKNIPKNLADKYFINNKTCRRMKFEEIKYFADNEDELEIYIDVNKYNL